MDNTNLGSLTANVQLTADMSDVERAMTEMVNSAKAQMSELNGDTFSEMQSKFQNLNNSLSTRSAQTNETVRNNVKQTADFTKKEIDGIDNALKKIAGAIGGYFAIDALRGYVGQIFAVRSQFASLEKSFNVLLGDEKKSKELFGAIKEFGATTPMNLGELASSAKMMLGFGISVKDVMPNLKALGDVAMGDSGKFMSLSLAFSQAQAAGKLMGNDLLQMINAGFNPLETMAKTTGKSISQLKDEMSKGKISADMLKQALMDATSEGGKYSGMLEQQSKTLAGAYSNLQDSFDQMYNSIGEQIEDKMVDVIHFVESLVANYKEVAKILAELTVAYGVYRTALWTVTAVQKASAIAGRMNAIAIAAQGTAAKKTTVLTVMLGQAQKAAAASATSILNMINPYTLLAAAIAATSYAIYKVATAESDLEKRQKKLNEINTTYLENVAKEQMQVDELFGKLQALNKGTKEYNAVKNTIIEKYGAYLGKLDEEKQKLNDVEGAYRAITNAIIEKNKYEALGASSAEYQKSMTDIQTQLKQDMLKTFDENREYKKKKGIAGVDDRTAFELKERYSQYIDEVIKASLNWDLENTSEQTIEDFIFRTIDKYNVEDFFNEMYGIEHSTSQLAHQEAYSLTHGTLGITGREESVFERIKNAKKIWENAQIMFQNTWEEIEETTTPNPTTTTATDNKTKKQQENKEKKYIEEYAKIAEERYRAIKKIDEDYSLDENVKKYKKDKITEQYGYRFGALAGEYKETISDERRQQLEKIYGDAVKTEVSVATEKANELRGKIATLEKTMQSDDSEKNRKERAEKEAELLGLDLQARSAFELSDYTKKAEAYAKFAKEYTESLIAVQEKENDTKKRLAELNKQMTQATTAEQKADLQRQIDNAKTEEEQFKKDQAMKRQILVESFGGTADDVTTVIDKMAKAVYQFDLDPIRARIIELNAKLRQLYAQREMGEDVSQEIAETEAELLALDSAAKIAEENLLKAQEAYNKASWSDAAGAIDKLGSSFRDLGAAVGGSGEEALNALGSIMSTTATLIQNVVTFTTTSINAIKTAQTAGVAAVKAVEAASVILAIISAVIQLGHALANLFKKKDPIDELKDSLHDFNLELEETKRLAAQEDSFRPFQTIFGDDKWGNMINNVRIGADALKEYDKTQQNIIKNAETISGVEQHGKGLFTAVQGIGTTDPITAFVANKIWGNKSIATAAGQYDTLEDTVANMKVKVQHKTWFRNEKATSLKDAVPSLFGDDGKLDKDALHKFVESNNEAFQKLSQDNQDYLKDMDAAWQEYQEAVQAVKDTFKDFFGNLGSEIQDVWTNAFRTGQDGLADFEKSWDSAIENMIQSMAYNKTIGKLMNDMENDLDKSGFFENPEGNLGAAIDIMESYEEKSRNTQAAYDAILQEYRDRGYFQDESAAEERKAVSGGITNMTQDTAEELNGRMTQIQSHTFGILENQKLMVSMQTTQLTILQGIHSDTAQLHGIRSDIAELKATVSDIQIKGLKMK